MISRDPLGYFLEQNKYSDEIDTLPSDFYLNVFRTTGPRLSLISQMTAKFLAGVKILSQVSKETFQEDEKTIVNVVIKNEKSKSGI